jgi:hypothetical protein
MGARVISVVSSSRNAAFPARFTLSNHFAIEAL